MLKKKLILMLLMCFFFVGYATEPARADSGLIKISVKEGFAGKIKSERGFPVQVTVENNGADFTGDILFTFAHLYGTTGAKVLSIDVPRGSTKSYSLSLPGYSEDFYNSAQIKQTIFLYKGSWKDNHEQAFIGTKILKPKYIDRASSTIGLLSEDSDRLKELQVMATSKQLEPIVLTEDMIPDDAMGLASLDYLLIDEFAISKLKELQQQAIVKWVQNGGKLIAGATPNAKGSYGSLYQLLPMKPDKETLVNSKFFQVSNSFPSFRNIPIFIGPLESRAEVVVTSNNLPMVVHSGYGIGEIWQTAFSLGDEPLSNWNKYGQWFAKSPILQSPPKYQNGGTNPYDRLYSEFAEINDYFPSSQFSIEQISLFLFIYLLLLIPFLYFLLKKLDRREHAWWIIIAIATISSIGIFAIGAKDRLASPQMNQMGIYQAENDQLNGYEAVTFLSNTGGDYHLDISNGTFNAVPGPSGMDSSDGKGYVFTGNGRKSSSVMFPNVEYWSTRGVFGQASSTTNGQFESKLTYEDKKLSGTIINHFRYDFEELYIWTGRNKINLGPVKSGESIAVKETMQQDYLAGPISQGNSYQPPSSQQDVDKLRREKMEYGVIEFLYNNSYSENKPIVYGYTKGSVIKADLKGRNEAKNSLALIYQSVTIESKFSGAFTINEDMLKNHIITIHGNVFNDMSGSVNQMELDNGEYDYILELPSQLKDKTQALKELEIKWQTGSISYSLLNHVTGKYLPLSNSKTTIKEQLDQYITQKGVIVIKLIKTGQGDPLVRMPELSIKGEVH